MSHETELMSIAEGLKCGEKGAFERFYEKKCDKSIVYLITAMGLDENDAYDVVANVFVKLPEAIQRFSGDDVDLEKWYITVLNNATRNYKRDESRLIPAGLLEHIVSDDGGEMVSDVERKESENRLRDIIKTLPKKQREAATLHYLEELTVSETANRLGVTYETAREHLKRARKTLTKKVKSEGNSTHWLGGAVAVPVLSKMAKADAAGGMYQMPAQLAATATQGASIAAVGTVATTKIVSGVSVMAKFAALGLGAKAAIATAVAVVVVGGISTPIIVHAENQKQAAIVLQQEQEKARVEAEKQAKLQAEAKAAAEKAAKEAADLKAAEEKAKAEKLAAEQAEQERIAAEKAEAERIAAEQAEAERLAAEQAQAALVAAEKAQQAAIAAQAKATQKPESSSSKVTKKDTSGDLQSQLPPGFTVVDPDNYNPSDGRGGGGTSIVIPSKPAAGQDATQNMMPPGMTLIPRGENNAAEGGEGWGTSIKLP